MITIVTECNNQVTTSKSRAHMSNVKKSTIEVTDCLKVCTNDHHTMCGA